MADVVTDIMTLLQDLGLGEVGTSIYSPQLLDNRRNVWGILVEQRNTSPVPEVLLRCDTLYVNLQVRGPGEGATGRKAAHDLAMRAYRALSLVLDRTINGTYYIRIYPDSAPYEVADEGHYDFLFGLEIKRYYGEE